MLTISNGADLSALPLPRLPVDLSVRERLFKRLSEPHAIRLITAPPGFGKTTAVMVWLEQQVKTSRLNGRVAWADGTKLRDPVRAQQVLDMVADHLKRDSGKLQLIIDAFDHVADLSWDQQLLDLVRNHRRLQVLLTGREPERHKQWHAPDLDIDVVTGKDLRFSLAESRKLLTALHPEITAEQVAHVHEQVGGWPILVRAAGLASGDVNAAVEHLRRPESGFAVSQASQDFVIATALARDFSDDMAAFLTDRNDNSRILAKFYAGGLLEKFSRNGQTRYRYLPAVGAATRAEIPEKILRERWLELAHWCSGHDLGEEAIYYGVQAKAWEDVPGFVQRHWAHLTESDLVHEAMSSIDAGVLQQNPIMAGILDIMAGPRRRRGAVPAAATGRPEDPMELLPHLITQAGYLRFNGQYSAAKTGFAEVYEILAQAPEDSGLKMAYPMARLQAALLLLLTDDLQLCAQEATAVYRAARDLDLVTETRNAVGMLALINALGGNGAHAEEWLEVLKEIPEPTGMFKDMVDTCAQAAQVLIEVGRLDLAAAQETLRKMNPATIKDEMWPFIVLAQTDYALLAGESAQGLRDLEAALIAHPGFDQPGSIAAPIIAAARANLLLAQSEGNRALAALANVDESHPLIRAARARIELFRGEHQRAIVIARTGSSRDQAHDRAVRELRLITAVAQLRAGEKEAAARHFNQFIADDGVGMLRALALMDRQAVAELVQLTGVGATELALVRERVPEPPFVAKTGIVALTPREQLVLDLLHQKLTIAEIAKKLIVSTNTIKSQTRSLYRKLKVSSRADALKRAAEYGLIG
ncbi:MAG TPA: LuxR C-terminal-related transcriptional regulator [Actinomycetales bacterium]|nr:LuxR C-terminal-related transcriptional regulator [Actinomycetales bacterium]